MPRFFYVCDETDSICEEDLEDAVHELIDYHQDNDLEVPEILHFQKYKMKEIDSIFFQSLYENFEEKFYSRYSCEPYPEINDKVKEAWKNFERVCIETLETYFVFVEDVSVSIAEINHLKEEGQNGE